MDPVKRSLWSLHLTVALLGGTALFAKIIPLSAIDITAGRSLIAFAVLLLLVKISGDKFRLKRRKDYWIAIGLGLLMTAHWVTYFAAMQYSSVSVGIIALFTFPVITVLLEPFFEGTRLVWQDLVSALVVLAGVVLLVPEFSIDNNIFIGIVVGVISAVLYSLRNLCHRKYFSHYGGAHAMAYQTLVIFVAVAPFASSQLVNSDSQNLQWLLILGIFFTALPHAMIATILKHLRAKTFSLVACMQPFYGIAFAAIVLQEQPNWKTLFGGLLIISAALYETLNAHKLHK